MQQNAPWDSRGEGKRDSTTIATRTTLNIKKRTEVPGETTKENRHAPEAARIAKGARGDWNKQGKRGEDVACWLLKGGVPREGKGERKKTSHRGEKRTCWKSPRACPGGVKRGRVEKRPAEI